MKKAAVLMLAVLIFLCGCAEKTAKNGKSSSDIKICAQEKSGYIKAVWISCFELDKMLLCESFEAEYTAAMEKCRDTGITDVFVHTVPFCDCYYESSYYPKRSSAAALKYDVLEKMTEITRQNGIRFHAWLNPYRVKTADCDIAALPENSPAKIWAKNEETAENVCISGGVYLNPASAEARKLIIDAVREIIKNYKVDGIHIDDYFYPTTESAFDKESYEKYAAGTENALSLAEYRRENVNCLISGISSVLKQKNIVFSCSPAASVKRDFNEYYADIGEWCRRGYLDYVIPQLYFGLEYPDKKYCFDNLLSEWKNTVNGTDTKIIIGLASYKIETEQKPDCEEWKNPEVIIKETEICTKDTAVFGVSYYSFASLFSENEANRTALEGIKGLLTEKE